MTEEEWRPVVGYEGSYEVSNLGRVRSVDRLRFHRYSGTYMVPGRLLTPTRRPKGHLKVGLLQDGQRTHTVHRLVLEAFVGPCPPGMVCCHNNGIPDDNRVSNLRWDTDKSNARDAVIHGANHNTKKTSCKRGHEFTEANTYRWGGGRACRTCQQMHNRNYKNKKAKAVVD